MVVAWLSAAKITTDLPLASNGCKPSQTYGGKLNENKEQVEKIEENVLTKTRQGHGRKTFKRFDTKCLQGMSEQLLVRLIK